MSFSCVFLATCKGSLNLRTVCNELEVVKHRAYEIGIQLNIPNSKLLQFKQDGNLLVSAVDHWLSGKIPNVSISWSSVVEALESKQVGETGLAEVIRKKYCDQEAEDDEGQCS